jgi:hypothetical protein
MWNIEARITGTNAEARKLAGIKDSSSLGYHLHAIVYMW